MNAVQCQTMAAASGLSETMTQLLLDLDRLGQIIARNCWNSDDRCIACARDRSSMVGHGIKSCVRALGRARGGGNGDEAEIEAGSDEDVAGGADPIVRAETTELL